jgi:hypothetical protein
LTGAIVIVSVLALTVTIYRKRAALDDEQQRITRLIYHNTAASSRRTREFYLTVDRRKLEAMGWKRWAEVYEAQERNVKQSRERFSRSYSANITRVDIDRLIETARRLSR